MENNINTEQELQEQTEVQAEEQTAAVSTAAENAELMAALIEARVKVALLMNGVTKEKMEEAMRLAMGFVATGMEPEESALRALEEYPHLKLAQREVPVFAAQSHGSTDGFAAIRSIFGRR